MVILYDCDVVVDVVGVVGVVGGGGDVVRCGYQRRCRADDVPRQTHSSDSVHCRYRENCVGRYTARRRI